MFEQKVAREAPVPSTVTPTQNDATRPAVPDEPVLAVNNIQGNIIGFNKDYQTLLFLKVTSKPQFRAWLGSFVPFIATAAEVLQFNRLFKAIRRRRKVETRTIQATWINVALSFETLRNLTDDASELKGMQKHALEFEAYKDKVADGKVLKADEFVDEAFKQGMHKRAIDVLGDPQDKEAEGNPRNWVFGGPKSEADVVIIVASDSQAELDSEIADIEESIYSGRTRDGKHANSGVQIIYKQQGATLPAPLVGHEHFGFLDGVSQPGLRGRISDDPMDVLTLRQNPHDPEQGKPGQDLLYPGEFIFGYPRQNPFAKEVKDPGPDSLAEARRRNQSEPIKAAGPVWAQDGSFFVVRRLRQDVDGFHKFLAHQAAELGMDENLFGAKLVGRWKSGAPVMRATNADIPALGDTDCANNHFEFADESEAIEPGAQGSAMCTDKKFPLSAGDKIGTTCPFASHIRKTYPRDDTGDLAPPDDPTTPAHEGINEVTTQTHRLLRRGIPFGKPFHPPADPEKTKDHGNRGLVFAAYQTSITEQFEFVTRAWSNNPEFKDKTDADGLKSGHDLIIGQSNSEEGKRTRRCVIPVEGADGEADRKTVTVETDWVIPTGGGYFFAPSIDALCLLTGIKRT